MFEVQGCGEYVKNTKRTVTWWPNLLALLFILAPFQTLHAASVPIDTLAINTVSLTIAITGDGTYNFSGPVVPPAVVTMGAYQDPIVGATDWKIYSTGAFGKPAPSGTVDGALGGIDVDFSSLRGQASVTILGTPHVLDVPLWPLTTTPSGGTYDSGTNAFTLNWSNNFSVIVDGFLPVSGTATVSLAGNVTPVPLPAAVWLFGSGLLGLMGIARRRKKT
jgi:hypothetical protein